jgi:hypothetical protein
MRVLSVGFWRVQPRSVPLVFGTKNVLVIFDRYLSTPPAHLPSGQMHLECYRDVNTILRELYVDILIIYSLKINKGSLNCAVIQI